MVESNHLKQSLEHFRQQREKKLQELQGIELTIRQIQAELGEDPGDPVQTEGPSSTVNQAFGIPTPNGAPLSQGARSNHPDLRADEFFGMSQGEAAKAYLERIGHAVSLDELVEALKRGGCKVGGADPNRTLYISLVRNVREFVPVQTGFIGLRSFYPNLRSANTSKNGKQRARKKAKKAARKPSRPAKVAAKKESVDEKPIATAVRQILNGGQLWSPDSILQSVQEKLGRPVPKVAVFGSLRDKKRFEKVGEQYRARK